MIKDQFKSFLSQRHTVENSGTVDSYFKAITLIAETIYSTDIDSFLAIYHSRPSTHHDYIALKIKDSVFRQSYIDNGHPKSYLEKGFMNAANNDLLDFFMI